MSHSSPRVDSPEPDTATLHVVVEGQTEEGFVRTVLAPHLARFGVRAEARCVMTSRRRARIYRGGLCAYDTARLDLHLWMQEDRRPASRFTTMFDLYALPRDFPGYRAACRMPDPYDQVRVIEKALARDLRDTRFIPYIQLHEFEALLLSDPARLQPDFPREEAAIGRLVRMVSGFSSPELINCGPETAPSKRIIAEIPAFRGRKASAGPLTAARIGLPLLRTRCPHFGQWLRRLETVHG